MMKMGLPRRWFLNPSQNFRRHARHGNVMQYLKFSVVLMIGMMHCPSGIIVQSFSAEILAFRHLLDTWFCVGQMCCARTRATVNLYGTEHCLYEKRKFFSHPLFFVYFLRIDESRCFGFFELTS